MQRSGASYVSGVTAICHTDSLLDRRQSCQNLFRNFPDFILPVLQIPDVFRIDRAGLVGPLGILIQIVAAIAKEPLWFVPFRYGSYEK